MNNHRHQEKNAQSARKSDAQRPVVEVDDLKKTFVTGFLPYRSVSFLLHRLSPTVGRALSKRVDAVDGLSFTVQPGEIFGLLGPNGAGKTTTLKMMMGLIFPDQGTIRLFGRPAGDLAAKAKIGFLPENPYFYDYLRAEEFLGLVAGLTGVDPKKRKTTISDLLEKVGLKEATDRPLRKFSKGMLQRIGLAQALINDPALVVLDEPLSGLDVVGRKEIRNIVHELGNSGKTVVFSSHILSDVEMLCDRVAIMDRGRLRSVGPLDTLLAAGEQKTEIIVENADESLLGWFVQQGYHLDRRGAQITLSVGGEADKNAVIERVLHSSASIKTVGPQKGRLEEVFVAQMRNETDDTEAQSAGGDPPKEES